MTSCFRDLKRSLPLEIELLLICCRAGARAGCSDPAPLCSYSAIVEAAANYTGEALVPRRTDHCGENQSRLAGPEPVLAEKVRRHYKVLPERVGGRRSAVVCSLVCREEWGEALQRRIQSGLGRRPRKGGRFGLEEGSKGGFR